MAGPWVLRSVSGALQTTLKTPIEFAAALRKTMSDAQDIEVLFAIWEQNVETVRAINRSSKNESACAALAQNLVGHLKTCAVGLTKLSTNDDQAKQLGPSRV
jgi:hypothetical protein